MGPYVGNSMMYLVETLFDIFIMIVMLRFLFQLFRADFYNPISQFLVKATNPLLRPLRRVIPGWGGIDMAGVVLLLALKFIENWLLVSMAGQGAGIAGVIVLSIAGIIELLIQIFTFAIFISILLSWIAPRTYTPMTSLLHSLSEPMLEPARRIIPAIGGLDISPIAVFILLQLTEKLLVAPIADLGRSLL